MRCTETLSVSWSSTVPMRLIVTRSYMHGPCQRDAKARLAWRTHVLRAWVDVQDCEQTAAQLKVDKLHRP